MMKQPAFTFFYHPEQGWSAPFPDQDSAQTLVFVFGDVSYIEQPDAVTSLVAAYPQSHIIGCSTSGEILGTRLLDGSLSVAVVPFAHTLLKSAFAPVASPTDAYGAGRTIAEGLNAPDLRGIFVVSEGLDVNGSELVKGINDVLPDHVTVSGGLAGDGDRFERTWVLQGKPVQGGVSAVGFYGERIHISHGFQGGWSIFGIERLVTRSRGNVLYEIDHKPALELYKTYLGDLAEGLPATALLFPLSVRASLEDDKRVVRTILSVNEAEQSLTFAGDIPEGHLVQLMKSNAESLISGAAHSALMTCDGLSAAEPRLSIAVSCVGRRLILGQRSEEELEATLKPLPPGSQQIGFYSYGEISPQGAGVCSLHNQTMTLTTLYES